MDQDLISVVMPAYNAEQFINEAIVSVIEQTYPYWELLIVDDGSTDHTAKIVQQHVIKDKRIKYIYQRNGKQGKARNTAIKEAAGLFLAFIDADDIWIKEKLSTQIKIIKQTNVDLLFSQGYTKDYENNITNFDVQVQYWNKKTDLNLLLIKNQIPILSVLAKKDSVIKSGYFCEDIQIQNVEDYHLWLKMLSDNFTFLSTGHRLFYYRVHNSQSTYCNSNLSLQTIAAFNDLILNNYLPPNHKTIIKNIRWFIFNNFNYTCFCSKLEVICPKKICIWKLIKSIGSYLPEQLVQKIIFHLL